MSQKKEEAGPAPLRDRTILPPNALAGQSWKGYEKDWKIALSEFEEMLDCYLSSDNCFSSECHNYKIDEKLLPR
ncbi:hypothetical protein CAEBREN_01268 [Caenorhabditis brenneri]|uniref:Uncharacterized protein n=1 Tax=Caenorhabditis brenneri TaxID=135651 RepID=G0N531_CAEBE|nr:hypothetical protein CAEBREN_01268 [Caenorhabditis brenneri]